MKRFLREPLFWVREALRWHWREVVGITAAVWSALVLALILLA